MKKFLIVLLACLFLFGCGSNNHLELQKNNDKEENDAEAEEKQFQVLEENKKEVEDKEVEIILKIMDFNTNSAEEYVEKMQKEDPKGYFSVYNEEYYLTKIKESKRKECLKVYANKEEIGQMFNEIYTDEILGEAIKSMDYDDNFQNFTFYVDKEKYESNKFMVVLGVGITVNAVSDTYQAYNFVMPEDRITEISFVDVETGEKIE